MRMIQMGVKKSEERVSYLLPSFFSSVREEEMDCYLKNGEEGIIDVKTELLKLIIDWVFKCVFSDENCKTSLLFLLRTVLKKDIRSFEFIPQEVPREDPESKTVVYDISVKLDDETRIDIEMQRYFTTDIIDRVLYYGTELMVPKKGENDYRKLNKSAVIVFIDDAKHFFPHPVSGYVLGEWTMEPCHILTDKLIYYFIDMKRIDEIEICDESEDLITLVKFLTCTRREEMEALVQKNEELKPAGDKWGHISNDSAARALAGNREKFLWDQAAKMKGAEERGREEEKMKIAKGMVAEGIPIETVCKITGLSKTDLC